MLLRNTRKLSRFGRVLRGALVTMLLMNPAESQAFFGLFQRCHPPPQPGAYSPCNPPPQTVSYVPQTCYRTQVVNVPVVTYRPITRCSPCTGRTTVMQPVTVMVPQQRMIPYTTYRYVVTAAQPVAMAAPVNCPPIVRPMAYAPSPCATGCGVPSTYSAARVAYPQAAPLSYPVQTNPGGYAPVATPTPTFGSSNYGVPSSGIPNNGVLTYGAPAPGISANYGAVPTSPVPNGNVPVGSETNGAYLNGTIVNGPMQGVAPSMPQAAPMQSNPPTQTFEQQPTQAPVSPMPPIPDAGTNAIPQATPASAPGLIDPASRTTSWPADRRAITPVSWPEATNRTVEANVVEASIPSAPQVDKDGWRPSSR